MWADWIPYLALQGTRKTIDSVGLPCSTLPNALFLTTCMDTLHAQLKLPVSFSFCPKTFHLSQCSVYWQCSPFHYYYLLSARPTYNFSSIVDWTAPPHCGCPVVSLCCWHTTVGKACQRTRVGKGSSLTLFFSQLCNQLCWHSGEQRRTLNVHQQAAQPSDTCVAVELSSHQPDSTVLCQGGHLHYKATMSPIHQQESRGDCVREALSSCCAKGMTKGSNCRARWVQRVGTETRSFEGYSILLSSVFKKSLF